MRNIPVLSVNSGYMTPLVDAREDIEKYRYGCRLLTNMLPRIYGPAQRRPGTKYIGEVKDSTKKVRMVPFIYSSTIAYQVEFGNLYCRFYYNGGLVTSGGNAVEVVTPYLEADLPYLDFNQSADVMWITHPSYAPRKLSRVSATSFQLEEIEFNTGPFLPRNDLDKNDGVTLTVSGYNIFSATVGGAGVGKFTIISATDISDLFIPNKRFYVSSSTANDGAYTVHATTATTYVGNTVTVYTNETVASDAPNGHIIIAGGTSTMTASSATFTEGHEGALFKLTHKRVQTVVQGGLSAAGKLTRAISVKGTWTATTHGKWTGTLEIQRMEDGENWETFRTYTSKQDMNIQKTDVETFDNVQYRLYVTSLTDGASYPISGSISVDDSTQDGIVRVTDYVSPTEVEVEIITPIGLDTPIYRWAEGSWSDERGYPKQVTFFEERIVYGYTIYQPNQLWLSKTGDFENFEAGTNDNNSFSLVLPTSDAIMWVDSLEALLVGTSGGEWRIRSNSLDEALTPSNFSIKQQTTWGAGNLGSIKVSDAILFIDYVGRKIREVAWNDEQQKFTSPDLTSLAENITVGGIGGYAYQRNPDSIVWIWLKTPYYFNGDLISLISMTYDRSQNVIAFAMHSFGETNGVPEVSPGAEVESVCVTPSTNEDVVTLAVKRVINGSTVRYIEQIQPVDFGNNIEDCFFVDCGLSYDSTPATTFSGLDHLEGETVTVLGDGCVFADQVVTGGEVTLSQAVSVCHIGLKSRYKLEPMRLAGNPGDIMGLERTIPEILVSFYKTSGASYGDGTNTYPIDFRTTEVFGSPPALFTGEKKLPFNSGFTTQDTIIISGSDPLPCTVRAIVPSVEI